MRRICARFRGLRGIAAPLLGASGGSQGNVGDVEMLQNSADSDRLTAVELHVVHAPILRRLAVWSLATVCVVASAGLFALLLNEWVQNPNQRGWLLLGSAFYVLASLKCLWNELQRIWTETMTLQAFVDRRSSKSLFEGITEHVEKACNLIPDSSSRDVEVFLQYDKVKRFSEVKLRFWGRASRSMRVVLRKRQGAAPGEESQQQQQQQQPFSTVSTAPPLSRSCWQFCTGRSAHPASGREVLVRYTRGDDVQTGRDQHTERTEMLSLTMSSTEETLLDDKVLLAQWCAECVRASLEPPANVVEVYGLQQASKDWTPEWQLERTRLLKDSGAVGDRFYLERSVAKEILIDATLWSTTGLRIYLILGPPGVGKSEFIVWLAGQLRLPVYRISLHSPKLTDDMLAQVFSHSWLKHDAAVVQLDEFQGALGRWTASSKDNDRRHQGISAEGLCEVLQGATTLSRGVVILSGTEELSDDAYRQQFRALYRRFNRTITISWLSEDDIRKYFREFLRKFATLHIEEWACWEDRFVKQPDSPWVSRPVSVDMIKQFLTRQVTEAAVANVIVKTTRPAASGLNIAVAAINEDDVTFNVHPGMAEQLCNLVCDYEAATAFLHEYAPVW
mmetsp:Transcript_84273/g.228353  ORF Transcript_84273/g.228353 Transcript_84273/m.228353 type:complete len:619 (+) Transcript_84273:83-1939(+)